MDLEFESFSKHRRVTDFFNSVQSCNLCSRLCNRTKVLSEYNGNLNSKVMFVAEAPGRLGADLTGIPLYGDKTGENFEILLSNISWTRRDVFLTNAVLCNPQTEDGKNSTPTPEEIRNCNHYLRMTIDLVNPDVVVSLGKVALDALNLIEPHNCVLRESVARPIKWNGRLLFPLYHPGPRALIHRSIIKQRGDYMILDKLVDPLKGLKRPSSNKKGNQNFKHNNPLYQMVFNIVDQLGEVSFFKLTKLLYLIDLQALQSFGESISGEIYLRQQEGPWLPSLKSCVQLLEADRQVQTTFNKNHVIVQRGKNSSLKSSALSESQKKLIASVLSKYAHMDNAGIKIVAYRTSPMKYVLYQEKQGRDMRKIPILYKNKTVIDIDSHRNEEPSLFKDSNG